MAATPESKVKTAIRKYLKATYPDCLIYMPIGGRFSQAGASDMLCCINGKFIALEVKAGDNKATPLQLAFIDDTIKAGGYGFVVYSAQDVEKLFYVNNL